MGQPIPGQRKARWIFYIGLAGGSGMALAAVALIAVRPPVVVPPEKPSAVISEAPAPLPPSGYGPDPPQIQVDSDEVEPKRLADAFEAATGHRAPFSTNSKYDSIRTSPLKIVQLPFGPVLLTQDRNSHWHASVGAIGVYYLKEADGRFRVTGRWPRAVKGWDWGDPPEWRLTGKFTTYPAIYAWGDFMAQGLKKKSATLTELQPGGPATSDLIVTGHNDWGGRSSDDEPVCIVNGRIKNIRKDRSFDVVASGTVRAVDRFVKRGGRFVAVKQINWEDPCAHPARAGGLKL